MSLGKYLVVLGLTLNIAGTVVVGFVVPRYTVATYGAGMRTFGTGTTAQRVGWTLLGLGFVLQLVGTVLWT